jgi:hypothetical protein
MDSLSRRKAARVWAGVAGGELAGTGLWMRFGLMGRGVARPGGREGGAREDTENPQPGG